MSICWRRKRGQETVVSAVMRPAPPPAPSLVVFEGTLLSDDALAWSIALSTVGNFDLARRWVALGKERGWTQAQTQRIADDCIAVGINPDRLRVALVSENDQR